MKRKASRSGTFTLALILMSRGGGVPRYGNHPLREAKHFYFTSAPSPGRPRDERTVTVTVGNHQEPLFREASQTPLRQPTPPGIRCNRSIPRCGTALTLQKVSLSRLGRTGGDVAVVPSDWFSRPPPLCSRPHEATTLTLRPLRSNTGHTAAAVPPRGPSGDCR